MYEFSIVAKYLVPRWRQFSVSIISTVSILVIAVAVWLIVVFFSVTNGLATGWVDKLIALTAPVRIVPTSQYYQSYYHLVDSISGASDYTLKTIGEKRVAENSDPYDPSYDEEPPASWRQPDLDGNGTLKDPVQAAFGAIQAIRNIPGLNADDYEMTMANLQLRLVRQQANPHSLSSDQGQNNISQSTYLGSFDPQNPRLLHAIMTPSMSDLSNLLSSLSLKPDTFDTDDLRTRAETSGDVQNRLTSFFEHVHIKALQAPPGGWRLPRHLLPKNAAWAGFLIKRNGFPERVIVPQTRLENLSLLPPKGYVIEKVFLSIADDTIKVKTTEGTETLLPPYVQLYLEEGSLLPANLLSESIADARDASDLSFSFDFKIQGIPVKGNARYGSLQIADATLDSTFNAQPEATPFWMHALRTAEGEQELTLPSIEGMGEGVLLPKGFHLSGVRLGDTGSLSYYAPTISSIHEQHIPIFVAGFYDPGIIPIGAKYVLTSKEITSLIRSFYDTAEAPFTNGINVRFDNIHDAERVKEELQNAFNAADIAGYWKIETYREYEFTRDIIRQLQSEKRLYTLLATLIIFVACSNIISMLIILVNDKKHEIGILRSMGANSLSIALIFGSCGIAMGVVGSLLGTLLAFITLKNIQPLVDFIGRLQGYEMFNPLFYGESLPSEISFEALSFVIVATATVSLIAGIIPAVKACLIKPSAILKAE